MLVVPIAATPAAQIALASLTLTQGKADAPQRTVIRLDPAGLGHVQLSIERSAAGPSHIVLAVERTDTLLLLLHDKPGLNQALTNAGVPQEGRTLQFSLANPGSFEPGGAGSGHAGPGNAGPGSSGSDGSGAGNSGSGSSGSGGSGGGPGGSGARSGSRHQPAGRSTWFRTGIDITA